MPQQWFLIKSLGATIDLSLVTQVVWNHVSGKNTYTEICLGTSVAYDPEAGAIVGHYWWICDRADRERLQAALVVLGLPTVELLFDLGEKSAYLPKKPESQQSLDLPF